MKHYRKITVCAACFLSLTMMTAALFPTNALPLTDESIVTVSSFSKSQKPSQSLVFSREDFTSRITGKGELSGIIISELPAKEHGQLMIGADIADIGETIELKDISSLCFSPSGDNDIKTTLEFIPIFKETGAAQLPVSVSLNLTEIENAAPIALDLNYETYANLPLYGTLSSVELEGETCSYTLLSSPKIGSVTIDKNTFDYTPTSKAAKDSFTYTATDINGNVSKPATIVVDVHKREKGSHMTYVDMSTSSAHFQAIKLAEAGVFTGESFGSNSFLSPNKNVSRAEFTALAASVAQLSTPTMAVSSGMSDNDTIPAWAQPYISAALTSGIVDGERGPDGNHLFRPSDSITRAEAAKIICRMSGVQPDTKATFSDSASTPAWAIPEIEKAGGAGLISPYADGSFRPTSTVTREDAVKMLYETMKYMNKNEKTGFFNFFN